MIYVEDELIKLNGVVLPGLVKSIEVIETAKVDEQEVEGSATKPKQATGYEDAKVNIELIIDDTPSQTKYQRYATLRAIFRSPGQSVPQPIPIISEDTAAHGVEKVIFKKLSHKGENKRGQLTATLELWEYIPQTITAKSGSSSGSSSGSGKSGGGAASNLKADYKSYLSNERGKSPARDDADATAAMNKVTAMPYYDNILVKSSVTVSQNISVTVTTDTADTDEAVENRVKAILTELLAVRRSRKLNELTLSDINHAIRSGYSGATNAAVSEPEADVKLGKDKVITLGDVSVTVERE